MAIAIPRQQSLSLGHNNTVLSWTTTLEVNECRCTANGMTDGQSCNLHTTALSLTKARSRGVRRSSMKIHMMYQESAVTVMLSSNIYHSSNVPLLPRRSSPLHYYDVQPEHPRRLDNISYEYKDPTFSLYLPTLLHLGSRVW